MRRWLKRGALAGVAAMVLWWLFSSDEIRQPPGQLAPDEPKQIAVKEPKDWWKGGYRFTPLAEFDIRARVLSRERYYLGRESELSPLDLVLGWGPMSDTGILDEMSISQSGRWYNWRSRTMPLSRGEIESHCANMHLIPAKAEIDKTLKGLRRGSLIHLRGYLVAIQAKDGWQWRSSLARDDTGHGSCEVIWVNEVDSSQ